MSLFKLLVFEKGNFGRTAPDIDRNSIFNISSMCNRIVTVKCFIFFRYNLNFDMNILFNFFNDSFTIFDWRIAAVAMGYNASTLNLSATFLKLLNVSFKTWIPSSFISLDLVRYWLNRAGVLYSVFHWAQFFIVAKYNKSNRVGTNVYQTNSFFHVCLLLLKQCV